MLGSVFSFVSTNEPSTEGGRLLKALEPQSSTFRLPAGTSPYNNDLYAQWIDENAQVNAGLGGHDVQHLQRMIARAPHILEFINAHSSRDGLLAADLNAIISTILLHNIDRLPHFASLLPNAGGPTLDAALTAKINERLEESPYDGETRGMIVEAVLKHSRRGFDLDAQPLLLLLRLLDRDDRLSPQGAISGFAWMGAMKPAYIVGEGDTGLEDLEQGGAKSILRINALRITSWVRMYDLTRELVYQEPKRFGRFLHMIRMLAEDIEVSHPVEMAGWADTIEQTIAAGLGEDFYPDWKPLDIPDY